jgi:hypothetical protein
MPNKNRAKTRFFAAEYGSFAADRKQRPLIDKGTSSSLGAETRSADDS